MDEQKHNPMQIAFFKNMVERVHVYLLILKTIKLKKTFLLLHILKTYSLNNKAKMHFSQMYNV